MICAKCGKEIPDESVRCNYCGAKVKIKKENNSNNKVIVILAIVIALLAIAFAAYVFLGNRNDKDSFTSDNVEELSKSVVRVECYDPEGSLYCTGSGVVVFDNQTVVTNYHVISGNCLSATITSDDGQSANVESILAYDENKDLVILKLEAPTSITPLVIGDSSVLARGDEVLAIGSPLGLLNTASTGIVSGFVEDGDIKAIQTTAPISSGSSGGALLNSKGELIGITYSGIEEGQNLGFAIPVNEVAELFNTKSSPISFSKLYTSVVHELDLLDYLQEYQSYSNATVRCNGYVSSCGNYKNSLSGDTSYLFYIVPTSNEVIGSIELTKKIVSKEIETTSHDKLKLNEEVYDFEIEAERCLALQSLRITDKAFLNSNTEKTTKTISALSVGDYIEFEFIPSSTVFSYQIDEVNLLTKEIAGCYSLKILSINGKSVG